MPTSTQQVNYRRIAKNAAFLYIRMALSVIVSLYTSRVVLQTLGVEDYGIYSLVGGIVVMFKFLNSSMAGATSRFLTFELGRGEQQRLKDTFSTALIAHIIIALAVFVVGETVGLWFLSTQLVIPEGRMFAAQVVYQCSIFSMMIGFTQVPYNASIVSHEKMDIFAYIELLDVFLRLGIVYLLVVGNFDKLILYAVLVLAVSTTIALIYRGYAITHYKECRFRMIWKPDILKPMLSFSGWNLYAQATSSIRQFSTNSIINIFYGVIYNAASGLTMTIHGTASGFSSNVIMSFSPQIIKQYAQGNVHNMIRLMSDASKYSLLVFLATSIPLIFELPYLLELWLGVVPEKTIEFTRLLLLSTIPFNQKNIIRAAVSATGQIKFVSFVNGTIALLVLIPIYLFSKNGYPVEVAYICILTQRIIAFVAVCFILKHIIRSFRIWEYLLQSTGKVLFVSVFIVVLIYFVHISMQESFIRFCTVCFLSFISFGTYTYYFVFDKEMRAKTKTQLKKYLNR